MLSWHRPIDNIFRHSLAPTIVIRDLSAAKTATIPLNLMHYLLNFEVVLKSNYESVIVSHNFMTFFHPLSEHTPKYFQNRNTIALVRRSEMKCNW